MVAAAFCLAVTCCLPWGHIAILHTVDLSVPGLMFQTGSSALAAAVAVLVLLRRSPILSVVAAGLACHWIAAAADEVPHKVMHQVIGVQLSLFPVNRLLDQFHLPNIEFAKTFMPKDQIIAPALFWSRSAAGSLLAASLLALPVDPLVSRILLRIQTTKCRACAASWPALRKVRYCPDCGTPTEPPQKNTCPHCGSGTTPTDKHCVECGGSLAATR